MQNAAIYIRVSTDEQTEYSPHVQADELLAYAKGKGLIIQSEHIYIDEGISGRTAEKRPSFMKMVRCAKKHEFTIILVHKFDRFARNKEDSVLYKALLKRDGVKVVSIKEPIPEDEKFAIIYESMLEAMAEYYSLNLAEEVKKTMIKKAHMGEYQSAAPYGYKNENKSLLIIPDEAAIVQYIFNQYLNHDKSFYTLAKELNAMGIQTHRGNPIENRTIQYILRNPVYCGYSRWTPTGNTGRNFENSDTIVAKSTHTPIISEEDFQAVQKRYKSHLKKVTPHQRPMTDGTHWLSGLVKCSNCGRSLVICRHYKNNEFSMQCGGYNHGQCLVSHSTTSRILIPSVLEALRKIIDDADIENYKITMPQAQTDDTQLQLANTLLAKNKQKLSKAKEAYLAGIDSLEEYKANKEMLEQGILETKEKINQFSKKYSPKNTSPLSKLENIYIILSDSQFSANEKQFAARKLINKIIYHKADKSISLFLCQNGIS